MKFKVISIILISFVLFVSIVLSSDYFTNEKRYHQHQKSMQPNSSYDNYDASTYNSLSIDKSIFSTHLPIIDINVNAKEIPGEDKTQNTRVEASVRIYDQKDKENNFKNKADLKTQANIKYRGNTSLNFDKKGFNLKLITKDGKENHQSLLGMDSHDTWILHGPYLDKTMLRNYMWYNISGELMEYSPNVRFCEVFLDDEYQGIYLLVEPITTSETGRVNISTNKDNNSVTSYIVELTQNLDNKRREDKNYLDNFSNYTYIMEDLSVFEILYPGQKNLTKNQFYFIQNDLSKFEKALYSYDYDKNKIGYRNYINMDSFVDYFILNEFTMNFDAGNVSTYIYKDPKAKFNMVIWDLNNTFDLYFREPLNTDSFFMQKRQWFSMMLKDEVFIHRVIVRYNQLRETYLSEEYLNNYIEEVLEYLGPALERNFSKWGDSFTEEKDFLVPTERNLRSFKDAIEQYKNTMTKRGKWLDENINSLYQFSHESKVKNYNP